MTTAEAWRIVAAGIGAFVLAAATVPFVRRIALQRGITDHPTGDRWHSSPTPYLGGVAITLAAAVCAVVAPQWQAQAAVLVAAAVFVGLVGLLDDLGKTNVWVRLLVETGAAVAAYAANARIELFDTPLNFIATVVVIVVLTNSFNLLDNVDGALGAIGTTIALALMIAALLQGQVLVGALAAVVAGACLGFLVHNWHPASIFMGDAGSLFLGFLLAAVALKLRTTVDPGPSAIAALLIVGAAVFDTTLVVVSRTRHGRSIMIGGTDHTSHRLLRSGLSHHAVTLLLIAGTAYSAGLGVLVARDIAPAPLALTAAVLPGLVLVVVLLRVPVYETQPVEPALNPSS